MRLVLEHMSIQNFKGCRRLELDFGSNRTKICGMNGLGKTTVADAFAWCLWNKDSHGNAPGSDSFRDKPLGNDGKEVHNLDTTVELICKLDGNPLKFRRTQRENWVKKRGYSEAVYQGNASTYWINGVETKLGDFKARISQIAAEDLSRLLSSLSAFNALGWKERRTQLLALSGTDVDSELLAMAEYKALADECRTRNVGVDDLRKILSDQRKRTGNELKMVPVRIDEARKAVPDVKPQEVADAEYLIHENEKAIKRIDNYITELKSQSSAENAQKELGMLEDELGSLKRRLNDEHCAGKKIIQAEMDSAVLAIRMAEAECADARRKLSRDEKSLEEQTDALNLMRAQFIVVRDDPLPEVKTVCPCCGQPLPQEAVERAHENQKQSRRNELKEIREKGKEQASLVEQTSLTVENEKIELEKLESKAAETKKAYDEVSEKLANYPETPDYGAEPRIAELEKQIETQKEFSQSVDTDGKVQEFEDRKAELQSIIDAKRALLARRDAGLETEKRIASLEALQKELGAQMADIERLIMLCEKFVQDRCSALEASINSKFPTVRWKLFDTQINGGIVDVCMCMIPCETGLVAYESANTASQIHADCEIINVLSKYYDVSLPVFIDNAERCNNLPEMDLQTIELYVSQDEMLAISKG